LKARKRSTKHELNRYESRKCCSRIKPIKWDEGHIKGRHSTQNKIRRVLKKWESKVTYDQYIRSTDKRLIAEESTFLWLSRRDMKAETESEIRATQDQALQKKIIPKTITN
jgi:ribosomal protein S3AE